MLMYEVGLFDDLFAYLHFYFAFPKQKQSHQWKKVMKPLLVIFSKMKDILQFSKRSSVVDKYLNPEKSFLEDATAEDVYWIATLCKALLIRLSTSVIEQLLGRLTNVSSEFLIFLI